MGFGAGVIASEVIVDWIYGGELASQPSHVPEQSEVDSFPRPSFLPDDGIPIFGVSGNSGAGKSSFVNTLLSLGKNHPDRVKTSGFGECSGVMDAVGVPPHEYVPKVYPYIMNGKVIAYVVDFPGIDGENFPANGGEYMEPYVVHFGVRWLDVMILVEGERITDGTKQLYAACEEYGVPKVVVRNKIDQAIDSIFQDNSLDDFPMEFVDEEAYALALAKLTLQESIPGCLSVFGVKSVYTRQDKLARLPDLCQRDQYEFPALVHFLLTTTMNIRKLDTSGAGRSQGEC